MRFFPSTLFCFLLTLVPSVSLAENPLGFDMGWSPERTEETLRAMGMTATDGQWLRVRNLVRSEVTDLKGEGRPLWKGGQAAELTMRRQALAALRDRGHQLVAMLRWPAGSWEAGVRPQRGHLPLDLEEAYERCLDLAFTYGDLIDAWEIENEPDISFVPENAETFAAFYKACALGILAGRELAESEPGISAFQLSGFSFSDARAASAIMHSPLALPPGPYWEELVANDVLSYTEAFNYHYYGYAEDFKGVRDQWVTALNEAFIESVDRKTKVGVYKGSSSALSPHSVPRVSASSLGTASQRFNISQGQPAKPLFLTEYGFGLLDRFDRHIIEGRERQKRFFELTLPLVTDGTITGAMVFQMPPRFIVESGNQFGLLAAMPEASPQGSSAARERLDGAIGQSRLSGVTELGAFKASEETRASQSEGPSEHPTSPENWKAPDIRTSDFGRLDSTRLSPVVIDFIAGENTQSVKRYNGHLLQQTRSAAEKDDEARKRGDGATNLSRPEGVTQSGAPRADEEQMYRSTSSGEFTLVLYNFSDAPVAGTLAVALENGDVAMRTADGGQRIEDSDRETEAGGQKTERDPAVAGQDNSTPTSAKSPTASAPSPYRRPDMPRSSLRPITEPNWPNAETPTVSTEDGRTYAITPALELLSSAAMNFDEGHTRQPDNSPEPMETKTRLPNSTEVLEQTKISALPPRFAPQVSADSLGTASELSDVSFSKPAITLAPMERREFRFTATLPNQEFRGHRLTAIWETQTARNAEKLKPETLKQEPAQDTSDPELAASAAPLSPGDQHYGSEISASQLFSFKHFESRLATQLYPSPSAFRLRTIDSFDFTAADNAEARARQLARPRVEGEAQLFQHPTAERWLSTPGVEIEETAFGWRITVNDLPPEPLRPAEIELPLPKDWHFPSKAALSFGYKLVPSEPAESISASQLLDFQDFQRDPSRYEELDINFRDANGKLWSVWPRLIARREPQSYLEPATNFTPMFFSRAQPGTRHSFAGATAGQAASLVLMLRTRTLPTTIEILSPKSSVLELP